ncbi:MAG TPA: LCCL domain-containing protein [Gemmataceae bacterium]|nr:LCCL domain-containing protein [Gemmataceae bacterium]
MYDRDGDGLLSFDEMPDSLRAERFKWDTNGDGFIDLAEWRMYMNALPAVEYRLPSPPVIRIQTPAPEFNVRELTKQITATPQPPSPSPPSRSASRPPFNDNASRKPQASASRLYPKNIPPWFKEYDTDGDGQVGLYEWLAKKDERQEFHKYDLNGDGYITVEELIRSGQYLTNTAPPQTIHGLGSEVGDFYYFHLTGSTRGTVWGTKVYTGDSSLAATAVHAGVLKVGETGFVKVNILAGQDRYEGTEQNGVSSQPFDMYPKSFSIEAIK